MTIDDLTIGQARELAALFPAAGDSHGGKHSLDSCFIGASVIVRTYSAGVHFGTLKARNGTEVLLHATRRIWYWNKAFTLSKIAADGLDAASSKLSVFVPNLLLTEAIEIIHVSEKAKEQLLTAPSHTPES
jgi:hypothetical protein